MSETIYLKCCISTNCRIKKHITPRQLQRKQKKTKKRITGLTPLRLVRADKAQEILEKIELSKS